VQHWCASGETNMKNLVHLCRHHLRLVHQEGYEILTSAQGEFEFVTPQRRTMAITLLTKFEGVIDAAMETLAMTISRDAYIGTKDLKQLVSLN